MTEASRPFQNEEVRTLLQGRGTGRKLLVMVAQVKYKGALHAIRLPRHQQIAPKVDCHWDGTKMQFSVRMKDRFLGDRKPRALSYRRHEGAYAW